MRMIGSILGLLILAAAAVAFVYLDKSLSGGSASNPTVPIALAVAFAVFAAFIFVSGGKGANVALNGFDLIPFLLLGFCMLPQWKWQSSPEKKADRSLAENIRCATRAAGIPEDSRSFVRARINMLRQHGDTADRTRQREIESRLGIRILPDCKFERAISSKW